MQSMDGAWRSKKGGKFPIPVVMCCGFLSIACVTCSCTDVDRAPARRRSLAATAVDVSRAETEFQRKTELVQTKTAVLHDKERILRQLELQLVARERAISWQERQLDVRNSLKQHAASAAAAGICVQSSSGSYWQQQQQQQRAEDGGGQEETEKYRHHHQGETVIPRELRAQRNHDAAAVLDHHGQRVRPPDTAVIPVSSCAGWAAMDKLEQQFARLAHTRTTDASPWQPDPARIRVQESTTEFRRPRPALIPVHLADRHLNTAGNQHAPTTATTSENRSGVVVRKRGRPRGSKTRFRMPPLTSSDAWIHNLYAAHAQQVLRNNPVMAAAVEEMTRRRNLAPQMSGNCELPRNAAMTSCRDTAAKQFLVGGHRLVGSGEEPRPPPLAPAAYAVPRHPTGPPPRAPPPPTMMLAQGLPPAQTTTTAQAAAAPAVMPARVRQMLASATYTTAASILPPLSPVSAAEFSSLAVTDEKRRLVDFAPDSFQRRGIISAADRDAAEEDVAYGVLDCSVMASEHDASAGHYHGPRRVMSEQAVMVDGRFTTNHHHQQQHLDQAAPGDFTDDAANCDAPSTRHPGHDHILPKVSSFDADRFWSCSALRVEREDRFHGRTEAVSDDHHHMSTSAHSTNRSDNDGGDGDDDDDDRRLVVVIDGD